MTHPMNWLTNFHMFPAKLSAMPSPAYEVDIDVDVSDLGLRLIHTPTHELTYLPPVRVNDETAAAELFRHSAIGFVSDIWTHILASKRDKTERGIYLIWDDDIPKPSPLTALFWLMVCESWPMPAANQPNPDATLTDIFPLQSIVLPASSHKLHSTQYPPEFVNAPASLPNQPLDLLLETHMTKEDRSKMVSATYATRVFRPQHDYVHYWAQTTLKGGLWPDLWHEEEGWPRNPQMRLDAGVAKDELISSWWHLRALSDMRHRVMKHLLTGIGLPTSHGALFTCPGGWIRQWSESCVMVRGQAGQNLPWSLDGETVSLADGTTFDHVPFIAPRIWLGWTHVGPIYDIVQGTPVKSESPSEKWMQSYIKHRPLALEMLFNPQDFSARRIADIREQHVLHQQRRLKLAGRLGKKTPLSNNEQFAAAFKAAINSGIGVKDE